MTTGRSERIALVGASGWIGRYLGPAMLERGICAPDDLVCVHRSGRSDRYDAWPGLRWETDFPAAVAGVDVVILSLRPGDFRAGSFPCAGRLVVSLMAGVTCDEVAERTGAHRVVRAMPNAAVEIGRSYIPWFSTPEVDYDDRLLAGRVLATVGSSDRLEREEEIELVSTLSGTGHAWPALLAGALLAAARAQGLPDDVAARSVEAIVCDAAQLLRGRIADTDAIVAQFLDYAGVTAAAITTALEAGFDDAVARAIDAGRRRAIEMGRDPA